MVRVCDWTEVLEDGETLLWQGRPGIGIVFTTAYCLFASNIAILTAIHYFYSNAREPYFTGITLTYLILFCGMTAWGLLWPSLTRYRSRYVVTNKRALVAVQKPFAHPQFISYPAQDWTHLVLAGKSPSNLFFRAGKPLHFGLRTDTRKSDLSRFRMGTTFTKSCKTYSLPVAKIE